MAFPTDDHQLIRRAMDGDERSLDQVLRHWTPQIVSWCRRLSGPRVDPDDVFQEVVEKVITRMDTLREPAAFPGWLFQVVRSQANPQRRRGGVRKVTGGFEGQPEGPAKGASPERHADLGETSLQVMAVLDRIPDEQRDILVLCFIEDRSQAEVVAAKDEAKGEVVEVVAAVAATEGGSRSTSIPNQKRQIIFR